MSRLSLRLSLQITSAAVMSSRVVMGRVFLCLSAVTGQNITVPTAPMSSIVVRCLYYSAPLQSSVTTHTTLYSLYRPPNTGNKHSSSHKRNKGKEVKVHA